LIDTLCAREWSLYVLHNGLHPYSERFILRFLHVTKRIAMMCWCGDIYINDGNSLHGLRIALRSNELLGCNCYNKLLFGSAYIRRKYSYMALRSL